MTYQKAILTLYCHFFYKKFSRFEKKGAKSDQYGRSPRAIGYNSYQRDSCDVMSSLSGNRDSLPLFTNPGCPAQNVFTFSSNCWQSTWVVVYESGFIKLYCI